MQETNINENFTKKFTIISLSYNNETSQINYNFPIDEVFDSTEEVLISIDNNLQYNISSWHTICPLLIPKEVKEKINLSQCLHLDSVIKNILSQEQQVQDSKTEIIDIEQVYKENKVNFPKL
jgi:hypothetical protein